MTKEDIKTRLINNDALPIATRRAGLFCGL